MIRRTITRWGKDHVMHGEGKEETYCGVKRTRNPKGFMPPRGLRLCVQCRRAFIAQHGHRAWMERVVNA